MKWSMWLKKEHPFTPSWKRTMRIGSVLGLGLALIMIFLQPFDTYSFQAPLKNLLLLGYAPCILVVALVVHPSENWLYRQQGERWYTWSEIMILLVGGLLMMSISYLYNTSVVNQFKLSFSAWWNFIVDFGSPLFLFLGPFWGFLRFRLGKLSGDRQEVAPLILQIVGQNKKERFQLVATNFIYAQAQQNYTELFYQNETGEIARKMLRVSISRLQVQIPASQQIHRSYLINPDFLAEIGGNARKRFVQLKIVPDPLPLSPKYYEIVQEALSNSAQ